MQQPRQDSGKFGIEEARRMLTECVAPVGPGSRIIDREHSTMNRRRRPALFNWPARRNLAHCLSRTGCAGKAASSAPGP